MTSDSLSGDLPWLEWRWKCSGMRCEGQPGSWRGFTVIFSHCSKELYNWRSCHSSLSNTGPCVFYYKHWLPCGVPNLLHNNLLKFTAYLFNRSILGVLVLLLIFVMWTRCPPTPLQLDCINFCKYFTLKLTAMDPLKVLNMSLSYVYDIAYSL